MKFEKHGDMVSITYEKKDSEKRLSQIVEYQTGTVSYSGSVDFKRCEESMPNETKKYAESE